MFFQIAVNPMLSFICKSCVRFRYIAILYALMPFSFVYDPISVPFCISV